LYQHKDSLGLVHFNSDLPAVSDTDPHPQQINTDHYVTRAFL